MPRELDFTINKEPFEFMRTARELVVDYVLLSQFEDKPKLTEEDVNIIWFTTGDASWRVLLGTNLNNGVYYRVSYDGTETRLDAYKMFDSKTYSDKENV